MFSQVKKFVYFFFLTICLSSSFFFSIFSAQINPQVGNLEDDRIADFSEFMGRFTLDEIKEDNKNAQEPLVTQALLETLTDEDKKILASFDDINDEKDLNNLIHLTLLHYQITELHLTEKAALEENHNDFAFDTAFQSLLDAKHICYQNITEPSKNKWFLFQDYLASHGNQFNFNSLEIIFLARQELCNDFKTFINAFLLANNLDKLKEPSKNLPKTLPQNSLVEDPIAEAKLQKLYSNTINSLGEDVKIFNSIVLKPDLPYLYEEFSALQQQLKNRRYCDLYSATAACMKDLPTYTKIYSALHTLSHMLPKNKEIQEWLKRAKNLQNSAQRLYNTLKIMNEHHLKFRNNFNSIYENALLFKTLYVFLYKKFYTKLKTKTKPIQGTHGTLKGINLPSEIFPLHQILSFKNKKHLNIIIDFNSFLLNNLLNDILSSNPPDEDENESTSNKNELFNQILREKASIFIGKIEKLNISEIWGSLCESIQFWLLFKHLWIWMHKKAENIQYVVPYHYIAKYFSQIFEKHIASLKEEARSSQDVASAPPKEIKKKHEKSAKTQESKLYQALEAAIKEVKEPAPLEQEVETREVPVAAPDDKQFTNKKIKWKQAPEALWNYFFTTQDLVELDKKYIAIHHFDRDGNRTMWSVLELDEKENKALSENYDVKSLKQDRFHCIPEATTFYLNRAQWFTKKDLAKKGSPGSKLNQCLAKPIEDTESHPLTDADKIVFIKAKIEPYGDTVPSTLLKIPTAQRFFGLRTGAYAFIFRNGVCRHAMFHEDKVSAAFHQR